MQGLSAEQGKYYEVRLGGATQISSLGGFRFAGARVTEAEKQVQSVTISVDSGAFCVPGGYGTYYCNEGGGPDQTDDSTSKCLILPENGEAGNLETLLRGITFYPEKETQRIRVEISAEDPVLPAGKVLEEDPDEWPGEEPGDSGGELKQSEEKENAGKQESRKEQESRGAAAASTLEELSVPTVMVTWHLGGNAVFGKDYAGELSPETAAADSSADSEQSGNGDQASGQGTTSAESVSDRESTSDQKSVSGGKPGHIGYFRTVPGRMLEKAGYTLGTGTVSGMWKTSGTVSSPERLLIGWQDKRGRLINARDRVTGDMDLYAVWAEKKVLYPTMTFTIDGRGKFTDGPEIVFITQGDGSDGQKERIAAGTVTENRGKNDRVSYTVTADRMAVCGYGAGTEDRLRKLFRTKQFQSAEYRRLVRMIQEAEDRKPEVRDVIAMLPKWTAGREYHLDYWNTSENEPLSDSELLRSPLRAEETYEARIRQITYRISYALNRGTNSDSNPRMVSLSDPRWSLDDPVREGYDFDGWYTDASFSTRITEIDPAKLDGNLWIYAKWVPSARTAYTVQYYVERDGQYILKKTKSYTGTTGETATAPELRLSGYEMDTSRSKSTGTVRPDGSLTLKLYYRKEKD